MSRRLMLGLCLLYTGGNLTKICSIYMDLKRYDLNLLKTLLVLLQEKNTSKAAERLDTSQPTVSRALARLRKDFNDPLFVRHANGLTLTSRGEALEQQLPTVMSSLQSLFEGDEFQPSRWEGIFRLAINSYLINSYGHEICLKLQQHCPNLSFELHAYDSVTMTQLERGELDAALNFFPLDIPKNFRQLPICEVEFGCICRVEHPLAGKTVSFYELIQQEIGGLMVEHHNSREMTVASYQDPNISFIPKMRSHHIQPLLNFARVSDLLVIAPLCVINELNRAHFATVHAYDVPEELGLTETVALVYSNTVNRTKKLEWLKGIISEVIT